MTTSLFAEWRFIFLYYLKGMIHPTLQLQKAEEVVGGGTTDLFVEDLLTADANLPVPIRHGLLEWIALLYIVRHSCLSDRKLPDL
jgi:hypothetical protein